MRLAEQIRNLPAVQKYIEEQLEKQRAAMAGAEKVEAEFQRAAARLTARMVNSGWWVDQQ